MSDECNTARPTRLRGGLLGRIRTWWEQTFNRKADADEILDAHRIARNATTINVADMRSLHNELATIRQRFARPSCEIERHPLPRARAVKTGSKRR